MTDVSAIEILPFIAKAMGDGRDVIEDSSREGGIFVDDEIIDIAADMEEVASTAYHGDFSGFCGELLAEIKRAIEKGDDPIEEVAAWLEGLLADNAELSA